jgi:hypothetical protein
VNKQYVVVVHQSLLIPMDTKEQPKTVFSPAEDTTNRECGICFDEKTSFVVCNRCSNEWCDGCSANIRSCPFCRYIADSERGICFNEKVLFLPCDRCSNTWCVGFTINGIRNSSSCYCNPVEVTSAILAARRALANTDVEH